MRHTVPTEQELFTKIAKHLLRQNARAVNDDNQCLMRDDSGNRCAVGCLINPKKFEPWMNEFYTPETLCIELKERRRKSVLTDTLDKHFIFLGMLQEIHDNWQPQEWPTKLRLLAEKRNLKMPETF